MSDPPPTLPKSRPSPSSEIPPAHDRIAVVVNGNAKNVTDEVISTLDQILLGGDLFVSRTLEEGAQIAHTVVARGYGTVLTGGGDGTFTVMVTDVVRACRQLGKPLPRFGFLRLGTGNAIAWVVGASKAKGRGLAADIQRLQSEAGSRLMHFVEVEGYIAPFVGFGIDAVVLRDYQIVKDRLMKTPLRRIAPGAFSYTAAALTRTLPSYLFRKPPHCRVINRGGDAFRIGEHGSIAGPPIAKGEVIYEGPAQVAGVGAIPYYGFGFRMFPYAEERTDRINLRISTVTPTVFVRKFKSIWRGDVYAPEYLSDFLIDDVSVEMSPATAFQIGGDPYDTLSEVRIGMTKEPIRLVDFYAPPSGDD